MKSLLVLASLAIAALALAQESVYVRGYVDKKGRYHEGHYRAKSSKARTSQFGGRGSVNPFTRRRSAKDPFAPKKPRLPKGF